jgi:D-lactate dehydrogenase
VLRTLDFVSFWAQEALPRLGSSRRRPGTVIVHPTCTLLKMGGLADLLTVARAHSDAVVVPAAAECCGFAGDRGFLVPELTASAVASEAAEVRELGGTGFYSTCRTCELGLGRPPGRRCSSMVQLVREALLLG